MMGVMPQEATLYELLSTRPAGGAGANRGASRVHAGCKLN